MLRRVVSVECWEEMPKRSIFRNDVKVSKGKKKTEEWFQIKGY